MRKELMKLLGTNYSENNGEIIDNRVQGYDPKRQIARIRETSKGLVVNRFQGYFYKPSEVVLFTDVKKAYLYIKTGKQD